MTKALIAHALERMNGRCRRSVRASCRGRTKTLAAPSQPENLPG